MARENTKSSEVAESKGNDFVKAPSINLPKGGGAIRGIGEKFAANPVTGTGSMTVPIFTSPGRSGFGPQLSLSYDSGAGNGPFGLGWNLSLPQITRKTDKGLPKYLDAEESDVFILSGAEDLVPVLGSDGKPLVIPDRTVLVDDIPKTYKIKRYRPRIEGLFARIERWSNLTDPSDVFWRSISKDNITTWYGKTAESRIADPANEQRIFSWLICETYDNKGNVVVYHYEKENSDNVDSSLAHERNRQNEPDEPDLRSANRYLKRISYGNKDPYLPQLSAAASWPVPIRDGWFFEVVFDYGEHDKDIPQPAEPGKKWPVRIDPFSSYRAGFEVRTYRLCQRVLMFHHIPDISDDKKGYDGLVRSTDFTYSCEEDPASARNPIYSFIKSVTQTGYNVDGLGGYLSKSLPPVEFEYSLPTVQETVRDVDTESLESLPIGLDGVTYQWTDLHGEGIPGILTEQADAWFYKRNLSPASEKPVEFAPVELVATKPSFSLAGGSQFMDLAGDGQPDLVMLGGPLPGLFEHDDAEGWQPFRPFTSRLNRDMRDPNLKMVDLDGDGHADVFITEDYVLVWHPSLAEDGFGPAQLVPKPYDEEKGPALVFADGTQSIYLADLSGDGMSDLVRIRNGEVCYWPNLGYGRFGAKVTMDKSEWSFDRPDQFDQKRIRLADIDGSGTTDIIYLHGDGVRIYFNQSGNSWSDPVPLPQFPAIDNVSSVQVTDLLGNGTACLVWSSPLPGTARCPMQYLALMQEKPHLLVGTKNNLGAETKVQYASSAKFYLQDKQAGKPWVTRLPFPVHVVERVETNDHISRNRFVTHYAYHHGYFDGEEREFRGFGMVEQWDTEQFAAIAGEKVTADNIDATSHVPPVHTKTWFHTGVNLGRERFSRHFEEEYFREPGLTLETARPLLLDDTIVPPGLTLDEEREACRALKGSMLRQEVYADDADCEGATPEQVQRAGTPYTVTEQNFTIRALQPQGDNRHAVFFTHACEALNYHYKRNSADPRIQHALTLEVDDYGNVLKQAAIGYGRRVSPLPEQWDRDRQTTALLTYTENRVTNVIDTPDTLRNPLPCETITFELTSYNATGPAGRYQASDFVESDPAAPNRLRHKFTAPEVPYEATATGSQRRRPIEWLRTLYRPDDCGVAQNDPMALLPLGDLQPLALPGESYKLSFTTGLLDLVFKRSQQGQPDELLLPQAARATILGGQAGDLGGYVDLDGNDHWWIPSGRSFYNTNPADNAATELAQAHAHFFLPRRYCDPFGQNTVVDFDAHNLLMVETRDALGNRVTVEANDYRVLQPRLVSDPNRNQTEVAFDTLGLVVGTAVMGKPQPAQPEGDSLTGFLTELTQAQLDGFYDATDPHTTSVALLKDATTRIVYDLDRFRRTQQANPTAPDKWLPACAATLARETHVHTPLPPQGLKIQLSFSYSDGFGREIQKKIQAEPGPLDVSDPQAPIVNPRWVGSGWTVFNNKGKPVRQYEPFFSATHHYEFGIMVGVSPVLFYDPAERVIATLHPNHTYEKVVFDPWQQATWDVNDTCAPRNQQTGDPRTDPDIGGYVEEYFKTQPATWQTWHSQRIGGTMGSDEQKAAERAAVHADTPTNAHFDALGRPFLTVARNRVVCANHDLDGTEDGFARHVIAWKLGTDLEVPPAIACLLVSVDSFYSKDSFIGRGEYDEVVTKARKQIVAQSTSYIRSQIKCALQNGEIGGYISEDIDAIVAKIDSLRPTSFPSKQRALEKGDTWGELLSEAGVPDEHHDALAILLESKRDEDAWEYLKQKEQHMRASLMQGAFIAENVRSALKIAELAGYDKRVIAPLKGNSPRSVARMDPVDLDKALLQSHPDEHERKELVSSICECADSVHPGDALIRRLRISNAMTSVVESFLSQKKDSEDEFDLIESFIDHELPKSPDANLVSGRREVKNNEELRSDLLRLQRVARITRNAKTAETLLKLNPPYDSAQIIALTDRSQFIRDLNDAGVAEDEANRVYRRARAHYRATMNIYLRYGLNTGGPNLKVLPSLGERVMRNTDEEELKLPTWADLFGSQDYDTCEDWESVLGQPAYLVDLLVWLSKVPQNSKSTGHPPYAELVKRRPDLCNILLNKANATTEVPHIDIACELLEKEVGTNILNLAAQDAPTPETTPQTTLSAEEIRAYPEHMDVEVYKGLRTSIASSVLPFDLPLEEVRSYLQIKMFDGKPLTRLKLIDMFNVSDHGYIEVLGLCPHDAEVIGGQVDVEAIKIWGDRPITNMAMFLQRVSSPTRHLDHLSYDEAVVLFNTKFIGNAQKFEIRLQGTDTIDLCKAEQRVFWDPKKGAEVPLFPHFLGCFLRFTRLLRLTKWNVADLDDLINVRSNGDRDPLDQQCLKWLAAARRIQDRNNISAQEISAFYRDFTQHDADQVKSDSLYRKLFPQLSHAGSTEEGLPVEFINASTLWTGLSDHLDIVATAFHSPQAHIAELMNWVKATYFNTSDPTSFQMLSMMYRHVRLAKLLNRDVVDLLCLAKILGKPFEQIPSGDPSKEVPSLIQFIEAVTLIDSAKVTASDVQTFLAADSSKQPDKTKLDQFYQGLADLKIATRALLPLAQQSDKDVNDYIALHGTWAPIAAVLVDLDFRFSGTLVGLDVKGHLSSTILNNDENPIDYTLIQLVRLSKLPLTLRISAAM